ncbi:MAG: exodeoxyribonuclease VII small subunit [Vallitaleaceae bacterium]|nr:exodeoxyribonuclease VII small subunit [Vallitaleaceae bacterium]
MSNNKSLEAYLEEIEVIVEQMEGGETSLEESIELYKKGTAILETCNTKIERIEKDLLILKEKK